MDVFLGDHKKFIVLLLKHHVDFILVGGYAVILYGYERNTADMDIWLKPDNENKLRFLEVLREYGIVDEDLSQVESRNFEEVHAMHIGEKPLRIDFLTKLSGVEYAEAKPAVKMFPVKNQLVPVIQYHHLIRSKLTSDRIKDKADVEMLQKINQKRSGNK